MTLCVHQQLVRAHSILGVMTPIVMQLISILAGRFGRQKRDWITGNTIATRDHVVGGFYVSYLYGVKQIDESVSWRFEAQGEVTRYHVLPMIGYT